MMACGLRYRLRGAPGPEGHDQPCQGIWLGCFCRGCRADGLHVDTPLGTVKQHHGVRNIVSQIIVRRSSVSQGRHIPQGSSKH